MKTPTGTVTLTDHSPSGSVTPYNQILAPGGGAYTAQQSYSIALTGAGQHYAKDAYQGDANYLTSSTTANCNTNVH